MSVFGEEIIDRLHENCSLRNINNPVRKIIDNGVGEWFDNYDDQDFFNMFFLTDAVGVYLDEWGEIYGVRRKQDEWDDDYRNRIIYEVLGYLTVPYLLNVYNLTLYTYSADFDPTNNTLVSDNHYLNSCGFMTIADGEVQSVLGKKFVLGNGLSFIEVE